MSNHRPKKHNLAIKIFSVVIFITSLIGFSHAENFQNLANETQGDIVLFSGNFEALISHNLEDGLSDLQGRNAGWHIPGKRYRAGTGWWALICSQEEKLMPLNNNCQLNSTQLLVTKAKHSVYDSNMVDSQLLYWSPLPFNLNKVPHIDEKQPKLIIIFKPVRSMEKLKLDTGFLKTYVHSGMKLYPSTNRAGTLEVRLNMDNGNYLDIVPRIKLDSTVEEADMPDIATFELRMGNRRQKLAGYTFDQVAGDGKLSPQKYLLWAGDLDGDNSPDLIVNHSDAENHVALYLSSLAKSGDLVGLAGSFQYSNPSSAGC
jgi:hypothetical protein